MNVYVHVGPFPHELVAGRIGVQIEGAGRHGPVGRRRRRRADGAALPANA